MEERTAVEILTAIESKKWEAMSAAIKATFQENGLTYRQAVAMLEYMKDRLMDSKV